MAAGQLQKKIFPEMDHIGKKIRNGTLYYATKIYGYGF